MSVGGPQRQIGDHDFELSSHADACGFTYWQAVGPGMVCDSPQAAHGQPAHEPIVEDSDRERVEIEALLLVKELRADLDRANSHNRKLMAEVNAQGAVVSAARLVLDHEMTVKTYNAVRNALNALDKATTPPSEASKDCLCLYAIKQVSGQPTVHDRRCPEAERSGQCTECDADAEQGHYQHCSQSMHSEAERSFRMGDQAPESNS